MSVMEVSPLQYQMERRVDVFSDRHKDAVYFLEAMESGNSAVWYNFAQFDSPAYSVEYGSGLYSKRVNRFLRARAEVQDKFHPVVKSSKEHVLGVNSPKVRFMAQAVRTGTIQEGVELLKENRDLDKILIVTGNKGEIDNPPSGNWTVENKPEVQITEYGANEVTMNAVVPPSGAWLVYADSFGPGWSAKVDGKQVDLEEAYMSFKAVWLKGGAHKVQFLFFNGEMTILSYTLALLSVTFVFIIISVFIGIIFPGLFAKIRQRNYPMTT